MRYKSGFVIAAVSSGSGKTTVTNGLLRAFKNRGFKVAPFKTGPDWNLSILMFSCRMSNMLKVFSNDIPLVAMCVLLKE